MSGENDDPHISQDTDDANCILANLMTILVRQKFLNKYIIKKDK